MNKKLSRFEQMMIAITFAGAGEFELSRTFADKQGEGHEQQPWMSKIADGELESAS